MPASAVFDLHCDTLTAFMDPTRCRDTLDDPLSSFALSKIPQGVSWCQCCAIFIPDGLTPKEARGATTPSISAVLSARWAACPPRSFPAAPPTISAGPGTVERRRLSSLWRMEQPWVDGWSA